MLRFELKKIWLKPINKAALFLLAVIVAAGSMLAVRDVVYYKEDGFKLSGFFAARELKREKNKWKGYVTEDVLKKVVEKNCRAQEQADSEDGAFYKNQDISDIREWINSGFSKQDDYDYFLCDNISPEEAASLYEKRLAVLEEELSGPGYSKEEKEYLRSRYKKFKAPLYYEYAEGWKALLDNQYLPTLMIITLVIIGFLVSKVFSGEFQLGTDSVFFSSKCGRNRAIHAKLTACFCVITVVYWAVMLVYSAIVLGVLGFQGSDLMIQTNYYNWNCMYNITYAGSWMLTMFGGYTAHLFILFFAIFVSAKSRSVIAAVTLPFALGCAPMFLGRIPLLTGVVRLFPDMLLRISAFLRDNVIYEIGGKVFDLYGMLIPIYLLLSLLMIPALYAEYRKSELV